jgi:hypothetical protein
MPGAAICGHALENPVGVVTDIERHADALAEQPEFAVSDCGWSWRPIGRMGTPSIMSIRVRRVCACDEK